jgi:tRNA(Ile)-lysidine synthase
MTSRRTAPAQPSREPVGALPAGMARDQLIAEVARVLAPLGDGTAVVVACSGGPDSTALLHLVAESRPELAVVVVMVRHGLRDDAADVDNVRRHAAWAGVPCEIVDVEVVPSGQGLEAAARDVRYAALRRIARRHGAKVLLLGHTADDQAETVLLRAARGTGVDGLAAMRPVAGDLWRPLLRIRRVDVHRFVHFEGLPVVRDPMNDDPTLRRNVVRSDVLAELDKIADDPVGALCRLADLAAADVDVLDGLADQAGEQLVRRIGDLMVLPARATLALAGGILRRVVRTAIRQVTGGTPSAADVARAVALPVGSSVSLPGGIDVARSAGWISIAPRLAAHQQPARLTVPGVVAWRPANVAIQAITPASDPWRALGHHDTPVAGQVALSLPGAWQPPPPGDDLCETPPGGHVERLVLALPELDPPIVVRRRAEGDRISLAGGTRSLQDVLVDADVPRAVREVWPVVTLADRLVWVPGIAADAALLRAGRRRPAIQLRVTQATVRR